MNNIVLSTRNIDQFIEDLAIAVVNRIEASEALKAQSDLKQQPSKYKSKNQNNRGKDE